MGTASLQDVMNRMARRHEALLAFLPAHLQGRVPTALEAFLSIDPVLDTLYKQYLDAKACLDRASKDWKIDAGSVEPTEPRQLATGDYEVSVASKDAHGRCLVDAAGKVKEFVSR